MSQVDVPGVLQSLQSPDEAEGCARRQKVDLQKRPGETGAGLFEYFTVDYIVAAAQNNQNII